MKSWLLIPWRKRVENAIKTKAFTRSDVELAKLWITDPFSELFGIVEFKDCQLHKGPKDINLLMDGIYFTKGVEENDVWLSFNCLKNINSRVLKIYGIEPWKGLNDTTRHT